MAACRGFPRFELTVQMREERLRMQEGQLPVRLPYPCCKPIAASAWIPVEAFRPGIRRSHDLIGVAIRLQFYRRTEIQKVMVKIYQVRTRPTSIWTNCDSG